MYHAQDWRIRPGWPSALSTRTLPGGLMACTVHTGYALSLGQAYAALYHWVKDNSYQIIGVPRQVHLQHAEHMDPSHYITKVQFPVKKQADTLNQSKSP